MNIQELKDRREKAVTTLENIREQQKQLVSYEAQLVGRVQTYDELIKEEEENDGDQQVISAGSADNSGHQDT
jgi:hypothetical protein